MRYQALFVGLEGETAKSFVLEAKVDFAARHGEAARLLSNITVRRSGL